jgi:hypothetical protein
MLLKITLIILALVVINFLLLKLSVNKTEKQSKVTKMPVILKTQVDIELESETLAPTGS